MTIAANIQALSGTQYSKAFDIMSEICQLQCIKYESDEYEGMGMQTYTFVDSSKIVRCSGYLEAQE
jgi:hypothetical protein